MTSTMKSAPQAGALEGASCGEIPVSASCCAGPGRRTPDETCGAAAGSAPAPVTWNGTAAPAAPTAPRKPRRLTLDLLLPRMTHPLFARPAPCGSGFAMRLVFLVFRRGDRRLGRRFVADLTIVAGHGLVFRERFKDRNIDLLLQLLGVGKGCHVAFHLVQV